MNWSDIRKLIVSVFVCLLAGIVGSVFTSSAIPTWYATLERPALSPPNWIFAPVWTTLYILMGVALWLVWKQGSKKRDVRLAMYAFGFQLLLNAIWSPVFFGLQSPFYGLVIIGPLFLAIIWTMLLFYNVKKSAAYLLLPYLAWVGFASYLNFMIWRLN